jgi:hypothetical protein
MSPVSSAAINRFTASTFSCDIARAVSRSREHGVFGGRSGTVSQGDPEKAATYVLNTFPKAELLRESGNAVG